MVADDSTRTTAKAQALATRLDRCADLVDRAADARSRAEGDLTEFACTEADTYRDDLTDYVAHAQDVIDRFRRTANRLRDDAERFDAVIEQLLEDREDAANRPSR